MSLGVRKCALAHLRAGVARQLGGATSIDGEIGEHGERSYRYLRVEQVIRP